MILIYLLKVSACTALFFGFYMLVLRKFTFFKINRFYLLATMMLSFIIPVLQFEVKREITMVETEAPVNIPEIKPTDQAPQLIQPVMEYQPMVKHKLNWMMVLYYVYGTTALFLLLVCLWRLFSLLKHTNRYTKNGYGLKLIIKTEGFTNCSFFNYVFINNVDLSATDLSVLLKHEQVHTRQYHSIDKMMLMVFKSILWFNPIVYLYDKALEQVHEYEADEMTSTDYGNEAYANLLLKLAITKSHTPLMHNFVKSPIKDRIKMLFTAKSKKMKKLTYLFAIPVALGLIWLFAVQVVYAQNIKDEGKPSKDLYEGALKGKVLNIKKETIGLYTFDLLSNGKVYPIEANTFKEKIKVGDELVVYISGKGFNIKKTDRSGKVIAETNGLIYSATKVTTLTGSLIYEQKIENHAFLYEANKARSASSKIKSIEKNVNGKIEKIVLNDGLFTINLNLKAQNILNNYLKIGDRVLVKFIGEKLVSKNTYTTDKMIVLYSEPKKYIIKNEALYNRFYFNDGKQKVAVVKNEAAKVSGPVEPKIISFKKMTGDVKHKVSYMENAVIDISNCRLEARYVELDQANNKMIAKNASLKNSKQNVMVKSDLMTFDLKKGDYRIDIGDETKTGKLYPNR
ncbi:Signal transducer regulating beta-lactamase production, contains metallopeptidase domain [Pedobacter terrae]|uniref:Signal transducer regulating beta-lactamase production, contains metallopeptidase domain n=1 Tax=Pedobacter terrae TaxID=405671 RepID=A0A1G7SMG9_9SPHI|nr:M56 family metallopeptidase [Pedobacter terrae]SDG24044.1 Signal transducer regulating beta-lactamase production, contains metallopeptidase domain [Pedobacter terrae]